jgi:hypothetical protein
MPSKASVRKLIAARVRRKELVPVALEGAGKQNAGRSRNIEQARGAITAWSFSRRSSPHISASVPILRLRPPFRGLCAWKSACSAVSLPVWSVRTSSPPSTSRLTARTKGADAKMELGQQERGKTAQGVQAPHRALIAERFQLTE